MKKSELIAQELSMAYQMKIEAMEELVTKLNGGLPYHNELQKVNNIDASLDKLGKLLNEAEQEEKENERRYRSGGRVLAQRVSCRKEEVGGQNEQIKSKSNVE